MKLSVEINGIHDLILFDTLLDRLAEKWKPDVPEIDDEDEDDDAEDEHCCCDDEHAEADAYGSMFPETANEKAIRKALDKLAECLRAAGRTNVTYHYCGDAIRRDDKR